MEKTYKRVCNQYVATKCDEVLLEDGNEVISFLLNNDNISNKKKITLENHLQYVSADEVYKYSSYEEFFKNEVFLEIKRDIEDLGIIDYDGNWNFYISLEDMKKIGLGEELKQVIKEMLSENEKINTNIIEKIRESEL